eukprot:COSAG03_NODE_14745_length_453_cov_1.449153_1_plen_30_part_10
MAAAPFGSRTSRAAPPERERERESDREKER